MVLEQKSYAQDPLETDPGQNPTRQKPPAFEDITSGYMKKIVTLFVEEIMLKIS